MRLRSKVGIATLAVTAVLAFGRCSGPLNDRLPEKPVAAEPANVQPEKKSTQPQEKLKEDGCSRLRYVSTSYESRMALEGSTKALEKINEGTLLAISCGVGLDWKGEMRGFEIKKGDSVCILHKDLDDQLYCKDNIIIGQNGQITVSIKLDTNEIIPPQCHFDIGGKTEIGVAMLNVGKEIKAPAFLVYRIYIYDKETYEGLSFELREDCELSYGRYH